MSVTSLLQPIGYGLPFSGTGLRQRRPHPFSLREPEHDEWSAPQLPGLASSSVSLAGPSAVVYSHLTCASERCDAHLFERLAHASKALRAGAVSDRVLTVALTEAHTQVITVDDVLGAADGPEAEASRQWLRQLQTFLMALLSDIEQTQQGLEAGRPRAEQDRQLLLQAASAKLQTASAPQPSHEGDGSTPHDSLDSSCSSSVCGSSCTSSAGTSKSGHRLVAVRSRLKYTTHWAHKIAI